MFRNPTIKSKEKKSRQIYVTNTCPFIEAECTMVINCGLDGGSVRTLVRLLPLYTTVALHEEEWITQHDRF